MNEQLKQTKKIIKNRPKATITALVLIFVGMIFLLVNFDVVPATVWFTLWRFWPIILILIGFQLLLGRSWFGQFLTIIISIVVLGFVFTVAVAPFNPSLKREIKKRFPLIIPENITDKPHNQNTSRITISSKDFGNVSERNIFFNIGDGSFNLKDIEEPGYILDLKTLATGNFSPKVRSEAKNGILTVNVDLRQDMSFGGLGGKISHEVILGQPDLPTNIEINLGVGDAKMKFSRLKMKQFNLKTGVGLAEVNFEDDATPSDKLNIEAGVGSVKIKLPQDIGIRVDHRVGLGDLKINGVSLKGTGTFFSSNYNPTKKVEMDIGVGTGSVTIETIAN